MNAGIIIGSVIGAAVIALIVAAILWQRKSFYPDPTGKIDIECNGLTMTCFSEKTVNFFIISDGTHHIAIDAGYGSVDLTAEFARLAVDPANVEAIFFTHGDFDHVGGIDRFPNAKLYLHEADFPIVYGTSARMFKFYRYRKNAHTFLPLKGDEDLAFGTIRVRVIPTPGHTPGSTSYLINDALLFTGDLLRLVHGKVVPFFKLITMDPGSQRASIQNIAQLKGIKILLTAHTGFTEDYKDSIQDWGV